MGDKIHKTQKESPSCARGVSCGDVSLILKNLLGGQPRLRCSYHNKIKAVECKRRQKERRRNKKKKRRKRKKEKEKKEEEEEEEEKKKLEKMKKALKIYGILSNDPT